jgi:MraZ protein
MQFLGTFEHTLDAKGRLAIPAKLRNTLGEKAVLTRSPDRCLVLYPMDEWNRLTQQLSQLSRADRNARDLRHFIFGGASECEIDAQGRIIVPAMLREYATLEGDVVTAGMDTYIEIWSKAAWEERETRVISDIDKIAAQLSGLI